MTSVVNRFQQGEFCFCKTDEVVFMSIFAFCLSDLNNSQLSNVTDLDFFFLKKCKVSMKFWPLDMKSNRTPLLNESHDLR